MSMNIAREFGPLSLQSVAAVALTYTCFQQFVNSALHPLQLLLGGARRRCWRSVSCIERIVYDMYALWSSGMRWGRQVRILGRLGVQRLSSRCRRPLVAALACYGVALVVALGNCA